MRMLIHALPRHESTVTGDKTLLRDIEDYENSEELIESRATIADCTGMLDSMFLIANQEAFSIHYRSSTRIGKMRRGIWLARRSAVPDSI
ncbi:MAG: hypothetical protein IJ242_10710 [Clostridia bacterium]|nr:hypothetical protein [Clostridia bacterium]